MADEKTSKKFFAINVEEETYERFNKILREIVVAKKGQYVTQDEAMRSILDQVEDQA